jgi:thioredoxin reductase
MIKDAPTVAIVGAGPAGMSCANACVSFGLAPVVIERADHVGGAQRGNFHENLWLLGSPGETGEALTRRLVAHYGRLPVPTHVGSTVTRITTDDAGFVLGLATTPVDGPRGAGAGQAADAHRLHARALLLATGTRPRATAQLRALAAHSDRVLIGALSDALRERVRAADVLILGGGDNALDHALFLAERGCRVRVATRTHFSARAAFLAACAARDDIELRPHAAPVRLDAEGERIRAVWADGTDSVHDWLLVLFGYQPDTDILDTFTGVPRPTLGAGGHVRVDAWQRTDVPGIYAAGDLTETPQPSVAAAIAQGLAAARAMERDLRAGA